MMLGFHQQRLQGEKTPQGVSTCSSRSPSAEAMKHLGWRGWCGLLSGLFPYCSHAAAGRDIPAQRGQEGNVVAGWQGWIGR
eukprot:363488-Chlamydomonas_euryale.AAC.9